MIYRVSSFDGRPASRIVYYDYTGDKNYKNLDKITFYGYTNNSNKPSTKLLEIRYVAEPGHYDKYLLGVTRILDTLQILPVGDIDIGNSSFAFGSGGSNLSSQITLIANTRYSPYSDSDLFGHLYEMKDHK